MAGQDQKLTSIPLPIIAQLDGRDAALWLVDDGSTDARAAASLCRLPWSVVLSERSDKPFTTEIETPEAIDDPLVLRRGLIHLVETDPADVVLPRRHLAVLLLNGRQSERRTGLTALTRRLTMLQALRRRPAHHLIVVVSGRFAIPEDLDALWEDGFRTLITFVSDDADADGTIRQWQRDRGGTPVGLLRASISEFAASLRGEYLRGRDGALLVRIRDEQGKLRDVVATGLDDPQRPVLASYDLLGVDALTPLQPADLAADEVDGFFADPAASWRPYAAGMPWQRDPNAWETLRTRLRRLDRRGVEENRILYLSCEPGAGATTLLRDLAWRAASNGYPTLVAKRGASPGTGLEMSGLLTRLVNERPQAEISEIYEAPCVLVFDQGHWEGREAELLSYAREIATSGRRVCMLLATGPLVGVGILSDHRFVALANLTHRVAANDAVLLGRHLNRFLVPHGTDRSEAEWRAFFDTSAVGTSRSIAAFWIVLSFWLQRQVDLGETVQSRVYRAFRDTVTDAEIRTALLRIAAFSTVREPLPDELLPPSAGWPISDRIEDMRKELGVLGLVEFRAETERYWAMAHSLLGRYLINGLFYDQPAREVEGYGAATNPEHMRFLILRDISASPILQSVYLREVAESFAVSIFKIDPSRGYGVFAPYWREVLAALDNMPRSLRGTSRTFLHHCAISRRRIASDPDLFHLSGDERVDILRRAAEDLQTALRLDAEEGGESDINIYNSLAHALYDLADAELAAGHDPASVEASRKAAEATTRRAYGLNPDNSFVVETYGRALLAEGAADLAVAASRALEVLALVYGLMERPGSEPRRNALGRLAESAFALLMASGGAGDRDLNTETGAIAAALAQLGEGVRHQKNLSLADLPPANRAAAAEMLSGPLLTGNVQAVKLRYLLTVIDDPANFDLQLELLQSLNGSGPAFTPQMQLELAVLMFQRDRAHEGEIQFRRLRGLWRKGEHFVEVPPRLQWLLGLSGGDRRQVRARVTANTDGRAFAKVSELDNVEVPFRAEQFGQPRFAPGAPLAGFIIFGHNGPLLRPLTAPWR